jgi:uncharacterized membrane protein
MAALTGAKDMAEGKGPVRSLLGAGMKAVTEKVRGARGKSSGGKGKLKVTNIVESMDVGIPVRLAYDQWTQFADFPSFTKKVENVQQAGEDQKLNWRAQIFLSHRDWEATILEQVPDEKVVWRSKGSKGHVDGAVTFHELTPDMTRILLVLEYYPQGFFEHTGNLWRAQGRRTRLELKHFRRHLMSEVLLHPDEIEGWRGVIKDGEVVQEHEADGEEEPRDRDEDERENEDEDEDDFEDEEEFRGADRGDGRDGHRGDGPDPGDDDDRFAGNGRRARMRETSRAPSRRREHGPRPDGDKRSGRAGQGQRRERGHRGEPAGREARQ